MRLVLDTCILVSALITQGTPPDLIYQAWRNKQFDLITSHSQLNELRRVLDYKKLERFIKAEEKPLLMHVITQKAVIVDELPIVNKSSDPDDNIIIATALAGQADAIVSGDKKGLLELISVDNIAIITARDCLERLQSVSLKV